MPIATQIASGILSSSDKAKLDGLAGQTITINGSGVAKNAAAYGFLPTNDALTNATNLQNCVLGGGTILIDVVGVYEISRTILLDSNTHIIFGKGVTLRKATSNSKSSTYVFVNRGAFDRTWNENITITGLCLETQSIAGDDIAQVFGLRAMLAFFYVKNLTLDGITILDNLTQLFNIQVCTFVGLNIKNVNIVSTKDGIHLGKGSGFNISNCRLLTDDDSIALNADDYPFSNPESGWIEDGVIENIMLSPSTAEHSGGGRILMLGGSWPEWQSGLEIRPYGDAVTVNGRMYVTYGTRSLTTITSTVCPSHTTFTTVTYADGLKWQLKQSSDVVNTCAVRNIRFSGINIHRRMGGFKFFLEDNDFRRDYYPGTPIPRASNIIIDKIQIGPEITPSNNLNALISIYYPVDNLRLLNCDFININKVLVFMSPGGSYPTSNTAMEILITGAFFALTSSTTLYIFTNPTTWSNIRLKIANSMIDNTQNIISKTDPTNAVEVISNDIGW